MKKVKKDNKNLVKRVIDISYKHQLSHIGSCLSVLDILDCVYFIRDKDDPVILSNGHAGLALYVVLEKYNLVNAEDLFVKHGVHPNRDIKSGIYVSTGSLGQGLPIATGMAMADKSTIVYCISSDGECAEGSIWESVRIASEQKLSNLKIVVNANGYGAYDEINIKPLPKRFESFGCKVIQVNGHNRKEIIKALKMKSKLKPLVVIAKTKVEHFPFLDGMHAHYKVLSETDYLYAVNALKK